MARTVAEATRSEILAAYAAGATLDELASRHGRSRTTLAENIRRWGGEVRRRGPARTYALDEDYFAAVDTEAKAYWLGFLFADGSVVEPGVCGPWCRVELQEGDRQHLEKLRAAVGGDMPIRPYPRRASAYIVIRSARFCRRLAAHGCVPNKTGVHGAPAIRDALRRHFYRGYFDGNGGFGVNDPAAARCYEVTGPPGFVADHQAWLMATLGLAATELVPRGPVTAVRYQGRLQILRLGSLLYDDAAVYLDRKRAIYDELRRRG